MIVRGATAARNNRSAVAMCLVPLRLKHQAGFGPAVKYLVDGFVDPVQRPGLVDHPGPSGGVQGEHVMEVGAGADDRPITDVRSAG